MSFGAGSDKWRWLAARGSMLSQVMSFQLRRVHRNAFTIVVPPTSYLNASVCQDLHHPATRLSSKVILVSESSANRARQEIPDYTIVATKQQIESANAKVYRNAAMLSFIKKTACRPGWASHRQDVCRAFSEGHDHEINGNKTLCRRPLGACLTRPGSASRAAIRPLVVLKTLIACGFPLY